MLPQLDQAVGNYFVPGAGAKRGDKWANGSAASSRQACNWRACHQKTENWRLPGFRALRQFDGETYRQGYDSRQRGENRCQQRSDINPRYSFSAIWPPEYFAGAGIASLWTRAAPDDPLLIGQGGGVPK